LPKRAWRERGRPRQDARDQLAIDLAAALQMAWSLGAQAARDLVIVALDATEEPPDERARKGRPADWKLRSFWNPSAAFKSRSDYLAAKAKKGLPPRPAIVRALTVALLSGDQLRLQHTLTMLLGKK
jgi:hypothetical protein